MLKLRVLTAIVLLAVLMTALFSRAPWPFALVTLAFVVAAGWEWGRLNGAAQPWSLALGAMVAFAGVVSWQLHWVEHAPAALWFAAALAWIFGGGHALRAGAQAWGRWPSPLRWFAGVAMLWIAWLALANARGFGLNFMLSVLCIVWMADIAAYAGGRALGRRKLAPSISPGKTWEGAASGLIGVWALAIVWTLVIDRLAAVDAPSFFSHVQGRFGWSGLFALSALVCALSVVGDLFESLVKRSAGVKDSSSLLPGHGGVLDRIDALLPTIPLALALRLV
jgi:phosphatidate cytidylyltransferase